MTLVNDKNMPRLQYITADNIHSSGVAAVFTTRNGGVSGQSEQTQCYKSLNLQYHTEGDSNDNVSENYRIITSALGFSADKTASVHQIHSDRIVVIDDTWEKIGHTGAANEKADALITNRRGVLLSVRMADCVPVLLFDEQHSAIAAIHSGWQGTMAQIAVKTVQHMNRFYGTAPHNIKAAIGPCIGQCCYEVGHDFYDKFRDKYGSSIDAFFDMQPGKKPHCGLRAMNKAFLTDAGVPEGNIEVTDLCTMCNPGLFYSHRRSGNKRGTMAALIGML